MAGEKTFEEKFGQLVENQLSENLPSLFKYRSGFQLIDKTDDDKKAVGITVFVVNGIWLYLMSFFIDGELKGMDVLYVKSTDTFVPARDNWISLFKESGDRSIGFLRDKADRESTSRGNAILDDHGMYKNANDLVSEEAWLAMLTEKPTSSNYSFNIPDQLEAMGKEAQEIFTQTLLTNPDFANGVFTFYKPSELSKVAEDMLQAKPNVPVKKEEVNIISSMANPEASKLKASEKKLLMRNGVFIEDNRTNVAKVFYTVVDNNVVQNPTRSGIYDVMLRNGEYKPLAVILINDLSTDPDDTMNSVTAALISLDDPNTFCMEDINNVFCKPVKDISKVVKSKPGLTASARSLKDIKNWSNILIVQGLDTVIKGTLTDIKKGKRCFKPAYVHSKRSLGGSGDSYSLQNSRERVMDFTGKTGKLTMTSNKIYIPSDARIFKHKFEKTIKLGSPGVIREILNKQADYNPLTLKANRDIYQVTYKQETKEYMDKVAVLEDLVLNKKIYAGQAQSMLKEASKAKNGIMSYMLKESYSLDSFGNPSPTTPSKKDTAIHVKYNTQNGDKAVKALPSDAVAVASNASKNGIKDVFDVAVIKAMLSNMNASELKKNYIKDMIKGMDRTGRLLLLFYWHNDQFKERYGVNDITELESTIKDVFLKTGDLVLFLKEKSIYNPNISENLMGTLSEGIGSSQNA